MRRILAGLAAAAAASLGAVILGEYAFSGWSIVGAGVLFGLLVAEVGVAVERRRGVGLALVCGAVSGVGLLWAGWISTGHELGLVDPEGWVGVALGPVTAGLRAGWPERAAGSRPEPATTE